LFQARRSIVPTRRSTVSSKRWNVPGERIKRYKSEIQKTIIVSHRNGLRQPQSIHLEPRIDEIAWLVMNLGTCKRNGDVVAVEEEEELEVVNGSVSSTNSISTIRLMKMNDGKLYCVMGCDPQTKIREEGLGAKWTLGQVMVNVINLGFWGCWGFGLPLPNGHNMGEGAH
jgi:hypothetical protein